MNRAKNFGLSTHNIGNYQCEWKTTIENPEKLKRFQHYINSNDVDEGVKFIKAREQKFPKVKSDSSAIEITLVE